VGVFESVDQVFPPVVVLGQDYEGCEESVLDGYVQWGLLEVDESLGSVPAIRVIDGRESAVNPAGVCGRESERERCEGRRADSEGDWCMAVRKLGQ